jgi:uncharacterized repeat protein (TIGR01451 family)
MNKEWMSRITAAMLCLVLMMIALPDGAVLAGPGGPGEGTFAIMALQDEAWQLQGRLDFNNYETRELGLANRAGPVKIQLTQRGHDAAYVDYVALIKDEVVYQPVSAVNVAGNVDVLTKVLSPEYDVCSAWDSTLEIAWDGVPAGTTLVMRAMEEDLGENHGDPLYYPYVPMGETVTGTLVNDGGMSVDGVLDEPGQPDFSVFWRPDSPHPAGYTRGWFHGDGAYLYAAVEVTPDNTPDAEDWGALYLKINGELREFRITPVADEWGAIGFNYTASVPYAHRIYEFRIPLSKIGAATGDEFQYGFGCYGTVSQFGLDFGDAPAPYPTLLANNGARHNIYPSLGYCLGTLIDGEPNGLPSPGATGDDVTGIDDEDGVVFNTLLVPGSPATIKVTATLNISEPGYLNAWIDFNIDGDWDEPDEHIVKGKALTGSDTIGFPVPAAAVPGNSFARFRLSGAPILGPVGYGSIGEVEDYAVVIAPLQETTLSLTPNTATNPVGTQHTVTATGEDEFGDPLVGETVTFTILSGPHAGLTGTGLTDNNGQATWTYNGIKAGLDTIIATIDLNDGLTLTSNTATKLWVAPDIKVTKTVKLAGDADGDGAVSPGDTLKYTVLISNDGNGTAGGVIFSDTPDSNTTLMVGSVTTMPGFVSKGNISGNTVEVNIGSILPAGKVTVTFDVRINNPLWVRQVANQGVVQGSNFTVVKSDDPGTILPVDPTVTEIKASPPVHGQGITELGVAVLAGLLGLAFIFMVRRRPLGSGGN